MARAGFRRKAESSRRRATGSRPALRTSPGRHGEDPRRGCGQDHHGRPAGLMVKRVAVAIIGAGSTGLSALAEVRKATNDFVVIDDGPLGTMCARVGCMSSKALIRSPMNAILPMLKMMVCDEHPRRATMVSAFRGSGGAFV